MNRFFGDTEITLSRRLNEMICKLKTSLVGHLQTRCLMKPVMGVKCVTVAGETCQGCLEQSDNLEDPYGAQLQEVLSTLKAFSKKVWPKATKRKIFVHFSSKTGQRK